MSPKISIVLPLRDSATTLDECLASIRAQSFTDYEVLAIDDGSVDSTPSMLRRYALQEPRLRVLGNYGRGLIAGLNLGLQEARGAVVARMDGDDRMHRRRLAAQYRFLERNAGIAILGSRAYAFSSEPLRRGTHAYMHWQNSCLTPTDMYAEAYVESPLTHPTVSFRRDAIRALGGYRDGDFPEDYELWLRALRAGLGLAKLSRVLLDWRQGPQSFSRTDPRYARSAFDRLRATYLARDPRLNGGRKLVFWGAGRRTRMRCRHLMDLGFQPSTWIDIDPRKVGNYLQGVPVMEPACLRGSWAPDERPLVLVYVAVHGARKDIARALEEMGYDRGKDYLMVG